MGDTFDGEVRLLRTDEGGRETPLLTGYRSLVRVGAESEPMWGVEITFDAPPSIAPGASAIVHFRRWAQDEEDATPPPGTPLFVYEGNQLVGTGKVR